MIWNSVLVMTLLDLAIIAIAGAMLLVAGKAGLLGRRSPAVMCLVAAIIAVATFYLIDLLIMHAGPAALGGAEAMRLMEFLHLEAAWPVMLIFVGLLFCALLNFIRERRRSARRISLLSDALPIAVCYVDSKERVTFANEVCAQWRHRPLEEIVGRPIRELMSPEAYATLAPYLKDAMAGSDMGFDAVMRLEYSPVPRDLHVRLAPDRAGDGGIRGLYALMTDVTQQKELEREVVAAGERERYSIGQDLHDNLGQTLTGASFQLKALAQRLERQDSGELELVSQLKETVQRGIEETRHFARLLAPAFDSGGLEPALESLAAQASELFRVECTAECGGPGLALNAETATHIYRIAQESLTNAVRHGKPSAVRINFFTSEDRFRIEILDDGIGIEPQSSEIRGMGINTMRYRARMIGADFAIERPDTGGTRVVCSCAVKNLKAAGEPATVRPGTEASKPMAEAATAGS